MKSQKQLIVEWLKKYRVITALDALKLIRDNGKKEMCMRLSARIEELRAEGYNIETIMVYAKNGKRYGKYVWNGTISLN